MVFNEIDNFIEAYNNSFIILFKIRLLQTIIFIFKYTVHHFSYYLGMLHIPPQNSTSSQNWSKIAFYKIWYDTPNERGNVRGIVKNKQCKYEIWIIRYLSMLC